MPTLKRNTTDDEPPRYTMAELIEVRRTMLRYARSIPPGYEQNGRRQIALSLRRLFKDRKWLDANTFEGSQ